MFDFWYRASVQTTAAFVVTGILITGTLAVMATGGAAVKPKPRLRVIEGGKRA